MSVGGETDEAADLVIGLARLLGYASCHCTARDRADIYAKKIQAMCERLGVNISDYV